MPPGKRDHDQRQDGAENEAPVLRERLQLILQQREGERADDRAEEIGEAAEHRHEDEVAGMRPVHQLRDRRGRCGSRGSRRRPRRSRRDHEGGEPKAMHVHAEIFGLPRIVADRLQVQPERRMHDPPHQQTAR